MASDPTGEGLSPTSLLPTSVANPQVTPNFCLTWLQNQIFHNCLPAGFNYLLEQLIELREALTYVYKFILKDMIKDRDE